MSLFRASLDLPDPFRHRQPLRDPAD
jgi:hypothetical protein